MCVVNVEVQRVIQKYVQSQVISSYTKPLRVFILLFNRERHNTFPSPSTRQLLPSPTQAATLVEPPPHRTANDITGSASSHQSCFWRQSQPALFFSSLA